MSETDLPDDADDGGVGPDTSAIESVHRTVEAVVENVEQVMVGQRETVEHVVTAFLASGHVLLEDVPGVGKTMLARAVCASFDGVFNRVQFTPDLLPADVTGVTIFNQQTQAFEFRKGPVFANVVLGDEINRAPPKTQSALLEAMEEDQVTIDGETHPLPDPFAVIATQNPVERDQVYELPLSERDRFMKRLTLGYPGADEEVALLDRVTGSHPITEIEPVTSLQSLREASEITGEVHVSEPIREYVTRLATYTREQGEIGASPRGSIALVRAAQARALLDGRSYVLPDDIQGEARVVLPHRVRTPAGGDGSEIVAEALETVPIE